MNEPDRQVIGRALSTFANTGNPRAAIDAFREYEELLTSDGALAILDDNLRRLADDAGAQQIFGLRRRAIVAARERGSEAGIAELYRSTPAEPSVQDAVNAPGFAPILQALQVEPALLTQEARDYLDVLVALNAGNEAALARVRSVRALVAIARENGFEAARSWIIRECIDALKADRKSNSNAVEFMKDLLAIVNRPNEARTRAEIAVNLADALRARARETDDDSPLEHAIGALEGALEFLTLDRDRAAFSGCHRVLGNIYFGYRKLEPGEGYRRALEHFELAITSVDPADSANRLHLHYMIAACLETLGRDGDAREQRRMALSVVDGASLDQAITLCLDLARQISGAGAHTASVLDGALESLSDRALQLGGETDETARAHYQLGIVLREIQSGSRSMHLDRALSHTRMAASHFENRDPDAWAKAEANLGTIYPALFSGEKADNREQAIAHLQNALKVHTRETHAESWAIDSNALAALWLSRTKGDKIDNAQMALDTLAGVVEYWQSNREPRHASESKNLLGYALQRLAVRQGPEAIDAAIAAFKDSVDLAEKFGLANLANFASNLASAHAELGQFDEAVAAMNRALASVDRETQGYAWAVIRRNQAALHSRFHDETAPAHVEEAVRALRECLEVFDARNYPDDRRDTQKGLGTLYMRRARHAEALAAFRDAIDCAERIYARAFTETGRLEGAGAMAPVYRDAAFCLAKLGQAGEALLLHERSRTRVLSDALELGAASFDSLTADQRAAAEEAREEIARLDDEMRRPDDEPGRRSDAVLGSLLQQARDRLGHVLTYTHAAAPTLAELLTCIPPDGALVMPIVTAWGGVALVVPAGVATPNASHVLSLDLTSHELNLLLTGEEDQPGLLRAYRELIDALGSPDVKQRRHALERYRLNVTDTCASLWQRLMGPVCERLGLLDIREQAPILIVPHGSMGLLPLHAAADVGAAPFVQRFTPRFAPSLAVLAHISDRARDNAAPMRLLAVSDSRGDLRFARLESAEIVRLFGTDRSQVLAGSDATPEALKANVRGATHIHFACHGFFSWRDARRSGLALAGDSTLDVAEFMSPRVDLGASRLVSISACESGLSDYANLPDEYLGLPAALLLAGAPTVVSTLWAVQDNCTSLLMSEFYRRLLSGTEVSEALAAAQRWLSLLTMAELRAWVERAQEQLRDAGSAQALAAWSTELQRLQGIPDSARPYSSPYYWAAFTVVGAGSASVGSVGTAAT